MTHEDRPIVFTISQSSDFNHWHFKTKDKRALRAINAESPCLSYRVSAGDVGKKMIFLSERFNNLGFAVLFEVD